MQNCRADWPRYTTGQINHFDILRSYEILAPPGEPEHRSAHQGLELIIPSASAMNPNALIRLGKKHLRVKKGGFLLFNAQEEHVEHYSSADHGNFRAIVITESMLGDILGDTGAKPSEIVFDPLEYNLDPELASDLEKIFLLRAGGAESRLVFESHATSLLIDLFERFPSSILPKIQRLRSSGIFPSNISRVKKVIVDHFEDPNFSLDDLSYISGISKYHLIRSFRVHTGLSPMRYLRLLRLEHAKARIGKNESISNACLETGFGSFSTFNKAFKRANGGRPPQSLRQRRIKY